MFNAKKVLGAPIAAMVMVATLAGAAEAAPRHSQQRDVRQNAVTVDVDYRRHGRDHRWDRMGPRQIRRALRHQGYHKIQIVGERRSAYIVRARGWRGVPLRLVVDARSGHVVRQHPVRRGGHWNYRW